MNVMLEFTHLIDTETISFRVPGVSVLHKVKTTERSA
jgi:hypothetical protein